MNEMNRLLWLFRMWPPIASFAAVLLLAAPLAAEAQQAGEVPRVGYINPGYPSDPVRLRRFEAFRQGLRELGYVEGRNIALEARWAEGKYDRYPALAADLVRLKVHVIVVVGGAGAMGRVIVRDLARSPGVERITVADLDAEGASRVAALAGTGSQARVAGAAADITGTTFPETLRDHDVCVASTAYRLNPLIPISCAGT